MLRGAVAVIAGYLSLGAWTALVSTIAWEVLGAEFAFNEGVLVSAGWILLLFPVILAGAALGGFVTAILGRSPTNSPVRILGGLVVALWLVSAVIHLMVDDPAAAAAPSGLSAGEAARQAVFPAWYNFTIPFVGLAGVLWGGKLRARVSPRA